MSAYRPVAFRPGPRYRSRRRGGSVPPAAVVAVAAVAALGFSQARGGHAAAGKTADAVRRVAAPSSPAAAEVVAYARARVGDPYLWGGTGPYEYDCSGLAMQAWASEGVGIERTSEQQWASERRVGTPQPGDLVFFAGVDGTWSSPGHVGIVVDPAEDLMIDAYGTGYGVRYDHYGSAASPYTGLAAVIGFTDPGVSQ